MPDPILYLQAMAAAFGISGVLAWWIQAAGRCLTRPRSAVSEEIVAAASQTAASPVATAGALAAAAAGTVAGCISLQLRIGLPPVSALDRFLTLLLPAMLIVELLALTAPGWLVVILRAAIAVAVPEILLRGSVYVSGSAEAWTSGARLCVVLGSATLLTVAQLLQPLHREDSQVFTSLGLAAAILVAGIAIMLAGYLKGGATTFPFAAAVAGTAASCRWMSPRASLTAVIQSGTCAVFNLLFIGCFFGAVPLVRAIAIFLAPVCCLIAALPWLRHRPGWQAGTIGLLAACLPLAVVLTLAILEFRIRMAPLL